MILIGPIFFCQTVLSAKMVLMPRNSTCCCLVKKKEEQQEHATVVPVDPVTVIKETTH